MSEINEKYRKTSVSIKKYFSVFFFLFRITSTLDSEAGVDRTLWWDYNIRIILFIIKVSAYTSNRDSFWLNTFFVEKPNEYFLRRYYLSLTRQSKLIEKKVCTILHNRVKWRIMTILILRFLIIIYLIILSSRLNQNFSGLDFYTVN